MNPLIFALSQLLLISAAVYGESTSNVLRSVPNSSSGSVSSEEFDQYLTDPGKFSQSVSGSIPSSFDARSKWARCPSVSKVPDQGCCDASFALVPTSVMTDRTCIVTNRTDVVYSAYDPITCCDSCVHWSSDKCRGGRSEEVWKYWANTGIVTESCLTYPYFRDCRQQTCPSRCTSMGSRTVASDKRKGQMYYTVSSGVQGIQQEIMTNGPVEANFDMYLDFATFTGTGIYRHTRGPFISKHSVKIIGWGTEAGTDYWLVVNTFGEQWGNRGIAKFLRGKDHLGIESMVNAAMPSQ